MAWKSVCQKAAAQERAGSKGFSLIEVMVALVISGLVLVGVFAFSGVARTTTNDFRRDVRIQQSLEGAMDAIGTDARLAGLGFAQLCNEVRIWHDDAGVLINPSSADPLQIVAGTVPRDFFTEEPFWVLRDGFQAHWRSANSGTPPNLLGDAARPTSASPGNHADSFDVMLGEPGFVSALGAFKTTATTNFNLSPGGGNTIGIQPTSGGANVMNPGVGTDLNAVRHLFPPGSFFLVVDDGIVSSNNVGNPLATRSCVLMQVTAEVENQGGVFALPVADTSKFNNALALFGLPEPAGSGTSTFDVGSFSGSTPHTVVPLGRFRWSRYEVDYTLPTRPYLVRRDIIGWTQGDPVVVPGQVYPGCGVNPGSGGLECQLPQLHLPLFGGAGQQGAPAPRTPIAPMIEDMQVAVGCDGFIADPAGNRPAPMLGFEEIGPKRGLPNDDMPNLRVDEYDDTNQRGIDEWLGNSLEERSAPDCVFWGTKENHTASWAASSIPSESPELGGFKMSPQTARITLLGKNETQARGSSDLASGALGSPQDNFYNRVYSIEDRDTVKPLAGAREYHTITEQFFFRNVTYRDPGVL